MEICNLYSAWIGIFAGFLAGAFEGLFFRNEEWRGGYGTWRRRMTRLAHISFFGVGFINLGYALSVKAFLLQPASVWTSTLLIVGAVAMPTVCYLSAWKDFFRHLFFIPVMSLAVAVGLFLLKGIVL